MLTNRDGIVGTWITPATRPDPHPIEEKTNLALWGQRERGEIFAFDLCSKIGFSAGNSSDQQRAVALYHLTLSPSGTATSAPYKPLAGFIAPEPDHFLKQLPLVHNYSALRGDRAGEIVAQLGLPIPFFGSITSLHPDRTPKTVELLMVALRLASHVVMRVKHSLACRRPHEYSPQIQPMIPVPLHATLPSGHATEAFIVAYVLRQLLDASDIKGHHDSIWCEQLMRLASRIAVNRTVAGVHFPVDSAAGCMLGLTVGRYFVARCNRSGTFTGWRFNGPCFEGDFDWRAILPQIDAANRRPAPPQYLERMEDHTLDASESSPALEWLWTAAKREWTARPYA